MELIPQYSVQKIVLVMATAIGAFGGFPKPPRVFSDLVQNEIVQWALVFVLCYQGGSGQDVKLAALAVAIMYVAKKALDTYA